MESYLPIIFHLKELVSLYKRTGKFPVPQVDCHSSSAVRDSVSCEDQEKGKSPEESGPFQPVSCCGYCFRHPSQYRNHLDSIYHSSRLQRTCSVCAKYFISKKELAAHKKKEHDSNVKNRCEVCGIIFITAPLLSAHMKQMHISSFLIKCDNCPFETWKKSNFSMHKRRCSALKPTVYHPRRSSYEPTECCGRIFKYASHFKRHKATCKPIKTYCCKMCNEYFDEEEALNQHRLNVHKIVDGRWTCMICGEQFATNGILTIHKQAVHFKSTVFECGKCPFSSYRKDMLRRHYINCHTEHAPCFCCDHCGQFFRRKDTLKTHIQNVHLSSTPRCEICSCKLKSVEEVEKHKLGHRPCQICGKQFKRLKHREAHYQKHLSQNGQTKKLSA